MSQPTMPQRKLRNYLLDVRFQLKFTGYLVAAALAIALLLGGFLWSSSQTLLRESREAVEARGRAAEASRELGNVVLSNALLEHVNDPAFSAELQLRSTVIDRQYDAERVAIEAQRAQLVRRQQWTWVGLLLALGSFIVFIALAGILMSHRIAGPIFRMKRITDAIAAGKFILPDRSLRPHDELHELFDHLTQMIARLREFHEQDVQTLEKLIPELVQAQLSVPALELRALQTRLRERLTP